MNLKNMLETNGCLCSLALNRNLKGLDISPAFEIFTKPNCVLTEVILIKEFNDLNSILAITVGETHIHCFSIEFGEITRNYNIIKQDINRTLIKFMNATEGAMIRKMSTKHLIENNK